MYIENASIVKRLPEIIRDDNCTTTDREEQYGQNIAMIYYGRIDVPDDSIVADDVDKSVIDRDEEQKIIDTIMSISDETLRDLLSITAYLLAQIEGFKGLYEEAMGRLTDVKKSKLLDAMECKDKKRLTFNKILRLLAGKNVDMYRDMVKDYLHGISSIEELAEF